MHSRLTNEELEVRLLRLGYALSKQVNSLLLTVSTNYGDIVLEKDDVQFIEERLRKRLKRKLEVVQKELAARRASVSPDASSGR